MSDSKATELATAYKKRESWLKDYYKFKQPKAVGKTGDLVYTNFRDPKHAEEYAREKKRYRDIIDKLGTGKEGAYITPLDKPGTIPTASLLADEIKNISKDVYYMLYDWQTSTNMSLPAQFKIKALQMEKTGGSSAVLKEPSMFQAVTMPDSDYIKLRALNQAYMEANGIKSVKLYRGTNGQEGEEIAKYLREQHKGDSFVLKDAPLAGYSVRKNISDSFGVKVGGVTVVRDVPVNEIVIHEQLMAGVTGSFRGEREFILLGGEMKHKMNRIEYHSPTGDNDGD